MAIIFITRKNRTNETNGVDYYFYSEDEFNEENNAFVEYNEYDNNYHAISYSEIERDGS